MGTNQLAKDGADFIQKLGLNPDEYPEITERLQKKAMRYHLRCFFSEEEDHVPLWKVEDMLSGMP